MRGSHLSGSICIALAAFAAVESQAATYYSATEAIGPNSFAVDMNESGQFLSGLAVDNPLPPPDSFGQLNYYRRYDATSQFIGTQLQYTPYEINNSGEIVLTRRTSPARAMRSSVAPGALTLTDLGTLNGATTSAGYGINNSGQVAGASAGRAFRSSPSSGANVLTDLGTLPGHTGSAGYAINDAGQVAGISSDGPNDRLFRSTDNGSPIALTDLGEIPDRPFGMFPTVETKMPSGINSKGQVVGYTAAGSDRRGEYAWISSKNGESPNIYHIRMTGDGTGRVMDINGNSEVVGFGWIPTGGYAPAYFHNGITRNLNSYVTSGLPGGMTIWQANSITESGQIAVTTNWTGASSSLRLRTYVLTPTTFTNSLSLFDSNTAAKSFSDSSQYNPEVAIVAGASAVFDTADDPTTGGVSLTGLSSLGGGKMVVMLDLTNPTQAAISSLVPDVGSASFTILSDASVGGDLTQWNSLKSLYGVDWDAAVVYTNAPTSNFNFAWDFTANQSVGVNQLAVVPEPASLAVLAMTGGLLLRRRSNTSRIA